MGLYLGDVAGLAPSPTTPPDADDATTRGVQQMAVFLCLFLNSSQYNKYYYVQ